MNKIVNTKSGKIRGYMENGLLKFLGIPFAKPPVGKLRFKRARPVCPWNVILDAKQYGDVAPQFNNDQFIGSEDCLTLNVVRPTEGEKLPVFVWIHGGGYMVGSASDSLYHGDVFAKNGILYVNFQYRLNVLGVFDFTTYKGCEDFESNCGLSDMVIALQWIRDNIDAFGGDPDNITIGGESAGGAAVVTLMAVPAVKGCFRQVIAESALPNCVSTREIARRNMDLFIEGMGWVEEDLIKLQTTEPFELIKGIEYMSAKHQYENPGIFLPGPVIDDLLPIRPIEAIANGSAKGVNLIIGTNLNEGTMFVHPEKTGFPNSWDMVQQMFDNNDNSKGYQQIKEYYSDAQFDEKFGSTFVHFATDYAFEMPSIKVANAQKKFGDVWMYRFEFLPQSAIKNGMLVSHAFELPCVFAVKDHEFSRLFFDGESQETQDKIINDIHIPWVKFIKNGQPDEMNWPRYSGFDSPIRIFNRTTYTQKINRSDLMEAWGDMRFYEET